MQIMRRGGCFAPDVLLESSAKTLSQGRPSEMPVERMKVRRGIFMVEFVDVAKTSSVGQGIARIHGETVPEAHSAAVLFFRFAGSAVVVAPATNNVEAFEREAGWVDLAMATSTAFDIAMLGELFPDRGMGSFASSRPCVSKNWIRDFVWIPFRHLRLIQLTRRCRSCKSHWSKRLAS